jgi:hypothetical protein
MAIPTGATNSEHTDVDSFSAGYAPGRDANGCPIARHPTRKTPEFNGCFTNGIQPASGVGAAELTPAAVFKRTSTSRVRACTVDRFPRLRSSIPRRGECRA